METEAGERLQVTGLVAPAGEIVTAHDRATVPVNELAGVTAMVEVLPLADPGVTLMLPLFESVKLLLLFGASQNPEHPTAKPTINGAAIQTTRRHGMVFIASLLSFRFYA